MTTVAEVVRSLRYKPGWAFRLGGPSNAFVCISATTADSCGPGTRTTQHMFEIPSPCPDPVRWLFECVLLAELHEAGEFFRAGDTRPFFPNHQDEGSPYEFVDRRPPC